MRRKKIILALTGSILFSVAFSLLFKWIQTGNPFRMETIVYAAIILLNVLILGTVAFRLYLRSSGRPSEKLRKWIIPTYIAFVLLAMTISLALVSAGVYVTFLIKGLDTSQFTGHLFRVELPSAIRQLTVWILLGSAVFFYIIWRKALEREHRLLEENLKYRYRTLRAQVNPHFLFNSLNTLSGIIYDDTGKADNYIRQLSGIYRYILENEEVELVPLQKEIEFVQHFFALQKERSGDSIILELDTGEPDNMQIVPVSLQILVENALKHNMASASNPLKINISRHGTQLEVTNNLQKKNTMEPSTRTGLINLGERTRLITGRAVVIEEKSDIFTVKLPLIRIKE